jgi:hypothetical protein
MVSPPLYLGRARTRRPVRALLFAAQRRTDDISYTPAGPLFSPTSSPLLPRRNSEFEDEHPPEVVIFVGFPGSGKTSFYKTHFAPKGYVHVVRFIVTSSCLSPELCADLQFYLLDSRFLNRTKTRSARARPASTWSRRASRPRPRNPASSTTPPPRVPSAPNTSRSSGPSSRGRKSAASISRRRCNLRCIMPCTARCVSRSMAGTAR